MNHPGRDDEPAPLPLRQLEFNFGEDATSATTRRVVGRNRDPDTSTYAGRCAARLRQLRARRQWSVEEFCEQLRAAGVEVSPDGLRKFERGRRAGGRDLPVDLVPFIGIALGFAKVVGWLPQE